MALVSVVCHHCGIAFQREAGQLNRALARGGNLFCGLACAGQRRRVERDEADRKAAKAAYDREYRAKNLDRIKAEKAARHKAIYDPAAAAEERKKRMPAHVEYCRRPEYRAKKRDYDRQLRASEYGPFAETYLLLLDLEKEIRARATKYERYVANGYYTRSAQQRRRELWQAIRRS